MGVDGSGAVILHHPINDRHTDLFVIGDHARLGAQRSAPRLDLDHDELDDQLRLHQVLIRADCTSSESEAASTGG